MSKQVLVRLARNFLSCSAGSFQQDKKLFEPIRRELADLFLFDIFERHDGV
jgi:hypothetical protein